MGKITNEVRFIVVHASDSPHRGDNAMDVHRWHTEPPRSWSGIGYNYVILDDGALESGRPEYWPGAHTRGFNDVSLGIMLFGRGPEDFNCLQLCRLADLCKNLKLKYPHAEIVGHSDLDPEGKPHCPGFDVKEWALANGLQV